MNSFKQHYIPVVLSIILLISFGFSACGASDENNPAKSENNTSVIDSNVDDETISDDPARDSDEEFDQLLVDKANKTSNKDAKSLNSDASNFYGTWSATSERAKYLYGNLDITINQDGTFNANVTGEDFSGTWTKTDYGIHFDNEYLWGVMYYNDKCNMIFDDDDMAIRLTKK